MAIGSVQFNPSTLKVSYNNSTSKAQMFLPICGVCTESLIPRTITIEPSGFSDQTCCDFIDGSYQSSGIAAAINGNSYVLSNTSNCVWQTTTIGSFGTIKHVDPNRSCSGGSTITLTHFRVAVTKLATQLKIKLEVGDDVGGGIIFYFEIFTFLASGFPDCDDMDGTYSNDITNCGTTLNANSWKPCGTSGQVNLTNNL